MDCTHSTKSDYGPQGEPSFTVKTTYWSYKYKTKQKNTFGPLTVFTHNSIFMPLFFAVIISIQFTALFRQPQILTTVAFVL